MQAALQCSLPSSFYVPSRRAGDVASSRQSDLPHVLHGGCNAADHRTAPWHDGEAQLSPALRSRELALRHAVDRVLAEGQQEGRHPRASRKAYLRTDQSIIGLQDFAVRYETFGEKIIAAEIISMQNDKLYGQWMALNVPYKCLEDLLVP